jgi:hypothetical protein
MHDTNESKSNPVSSGLKIDDRILNEIFV